MSDSTSLLDVIPAAVADPPSAVNNLILQLSQGFAFANRPSTSGALTWGYNGTDRWYINATAVVKANGTIALTASSIRYVSVDRALALTEIATAFAPDKLALYKITTSGSAATAWGDHRDPHHINRFLYGRFVLAMADANKTLTYEQAMCESMELTGALTALRDVIVPQVPRNWTVFANVTGGFGIRVIGASGTGITIADGKRAIVECDGTNVVRITADV